MTAPNPTLALRDLLLHLFGPSELRDHVRFGPEGTGIWSHLPESATPAELALEVVQLLDRRAMIDQAFFERLVETRPRRRSEIEVVARLYGLGMPVSPHPGPDGSAVPHDAEHPRPPAASPHESPPSDSEQTVFAPSPPEAESDPPPPVDPLATPAPLQTPHPSETSKPAWLWIVGLTSIGALALALALTDLESCSPQPLSSVNARAEPPPPAPPARTTPPDTTTPSTTGPTAPGLISTPTTEPGTRDTTGGDAAPPLEAPPEPPSDAHRTTEPQEAPERSPRAIIAEVRRQAGNDIRTCANAAGADGSERVTAQLSIDKHGLVTVISISDDGLGQAFKECTKNALRQVHLAPGASQRQSVRLDL